MKRNYESPKMYAETFVPNQYCKGCDLMESFIPATKVRCESDGHLNTAQDTIFLQGTQGCVGIYNPNLKDDNCHGTTGWNGHAGERTYGTGPVDGTWGTKNIGSNKRPNNVKWFYEGAGDDTAIKGFFEQGGHRHVFYVTEEQQEVMHLS